jgi:hypothetical protein
VISQGLVDKKRFPGPTHYKPRSGMTDRKDVYSKTNLKSSIQYSFSRASLPWQKDIKPVPGSVYVMRNATENQVEGKYRSAPRVRIGKAVRRVGADLPEDTPGPGSYWV